VLISLSKNISHSKTFKPIPEAENDELCDFYEETAPECELKPSMLVWIDLNLDGEKEILIDGRDILTYQNSDEYSTWLFKKGETKFVLLNHFWRYDIEVLSNKTNNYFDLSQNYKGYNETNEGERVFGFKKRVYKFDKATGQYALSGQN
jgi:hypothetical protein